MEKIIRISPNDNVGVALESVSKGFNWKGVTAAEDIRAGHKIALVGLEPGEPVVKYGFVIGRATHRIPAGSHVHGHNLRTDLTAVTPSAPLEAAAGFFTRNISPFSRREFYGFPREDGRIGIRNELWILPLVGCINGPARKLAEAASHRWAGKGMQAVALEHPYGCSQIGDDLENTANLLAALARHPNAGGTLVLSLGCENNTLESFLPRLGDFDRSRIASLRMQEPGDEMQRSMELLQMLAERAEKDHRKPFSADRLVVGLKCGGSDGFSGITANPLLGLFSDRLAAVGGTTLMTEVPEMFGAESLLLARYRDTMERGKCFEMIDAFRRYFVDHRQPVYENPSPGNRDGGLTTLEEKSLGCTQKGGTAALVDVLPYAGRTEKCGPQLLAAPGNDLVSSTALAAAGAQLILFTTGRGTPFGTVVPTVKISTRTDLYEEKPHWIDFDAGRMLHGDDRNATADELFEFVLQVASGERQTNNERNGCREIAIFKNGVTL